MQQRKKHNSENLKPIQVTTKLPDPLKTQRPEAYIILPSFQIQTQAQTTPANHNATSKNITNTHFTFSTEGPKTTSNSHKFCPHQRKQKQKDQIFTIVSKI